MEWHSVATPRRSSRRSCRSRADVLRSGNVLLERPHLSPRNALHAATALNNGIETIVSADTDLDGLDGIRRLDPVLAG
jgi:predicted nucleic acid-binding protein